jgi:alanyl aminopeptidase
VLGRAGFKFPYQLVLEVPAAQEAIANTPPEGTTEKDGWKTVTFKRTPPLPSYLLAIAVGPFEYTPVAGTKVPTRIITCQGQKHLAGTTAQSAPKLLAGLERWFGTPYPFEKLDLIAVPEFAYGAMENPGLITFRDDALLLDPASASTSQRRSNAKRHLPRAGAHVVRRPGDDGVVGRPVAQRVVRRLDGGEGHGPGVPAVPPGPEQPAAHPDRARRRHPAVDDRDPRQHHQLGRGLSNVGLVYSKGNAVLSMFERYLGPETFQKGVQAYLKKHAWGNATAADLWQALDQASGTNVSAAMTTFLDQPGVPYVRVVPAPGGVRLTQSRATPYGVSQPPVRWDVPMTLQWSDGKTVRSQRVMLKDESAVVKLPAAPAWVMPNGGGHGYYAWSVPEEWMSALAENAAKLLGPDERVAFIGNLSILMKQGEVRGDTYLQSLSHFGSDPEPQVVVSTMEELNGVRARSSPTASRACSPSTCAARCRRRSSVWATRRSRARTRRCPGCAATCCAGSRTAARTRRCWRTRRTRRSATWRIRRAWTRASPTPWCRWRPRGRRETVRRVHPPARGHRGARDPAPVPGCAGCVRGARAPDPHAGLRPLRQGAAHRDVHDPAGIRPARRGHR